MFLLDAPACLLAKTKLSQLMGQKVFKKENELNYYL